VEPGRRLGAEGGAAAAPSPPAHNERLCDTWLWDGQRWDARLGDFPPEVLPFSRSHHGLAWDADRGKVVLFGGFPPDPRPMLSTWEYRPPR
jgi:hypothetical protein